MNKKTRGQKPLAFERTPKCVTTLGEECKSEQLNLVGSATGRACAPNAADLASGTQRPACAPGVEKVVSIGKRARKGRLFKVLGAGGLAFFMGAGVLCGVLVAPGNVKATSSAELEQQIQNEMQAKLLAGEDLGLDPENDPVVYTTDYGLEIKSHDAVGPQLTSTVITGANGTSSASGVGGYQYITAAGYNWVIIGQYDTSTYSHMSGTVYHDFYGNNTIAENAIDNDPNNALAMIKTSTIPVFAKAVVPSNGEIAWGHVLCLSEVAISGRTAFGSTNDYSKSSVKTQIETFYNSNSDLQSLPIAPQTINTLYSSTSSSIKNAYLFPLAARDAKLENFHVETYLPTDNLRAFGGAWTERINWWWLRSGDSANTIGGYGVESDGSVGANKSVSGNSYTIRAAFVLKLFR